MDQDLNYQKISKLMAAMLEAGTDPKELMDHCHQIVDQYASSESQEDPKEEAAESPDEEAAEDKPMPKGKMPKGKMPLGLTIVLGHSKK